MLETRRRKSDGAVNRWAVLAAAGTLNALVGAIYVWSIVSVALASEYGWSAQGIAFAYSLYIVCECCSGFLAGYLQTRMDSRMLTLCGGVCLASGWFLAGFADAVPLLYLTFSTVSYTHLDRIDRHRSREDLHLLLDGQRISPNTRRRARCRARLRHAMP